MGVLGNLKLEIIPRETKYHSSVVSSILYLFKVFSCSPYRKLTHYMPLSSHKMICIHYFPRSSQQRCRLILEMIRACKILRGDISYQINVCLYQLIRIRVTARHGLQKIVPRKGLCIKSHQQQPLRANTHIIINYVCNSRMQTQSTTQGIQLITSFGKQHTSLQMT